jgi:signal transduction histidine kinase
MIHPDDRSLVLARLSVAISEPGISIWEQEYRFRNAAGVFVHVHDRACIIRNRQRKAIRLVGVTQDISGRMLKHQQALEALVTKQQKTDQEMLAFRDWENEAIGRELFNNIGQALTASKMHLHMAATSEAQQQENITKSLLYVTEVIAEIERLANRLVKAPLNFVGIFEILRSLTARISLSQKLSMRFTAASVLEEEINEHLQEIIFRIVRIQLTNIMERSSAQASIRISKKNETILLAITDDGRKPPASPEQKAVTAAIKKQAAATKGSVKTRAGRHTGYTLTISFPFPATGDTTVKVNKVTRKAASPADASSALPALHLQNLNNR